MLRRASLTFVLCALAFTAVAAAQPPAPVNINLLQHHRVFLGRAVDQIAVQLDLEAPAEGWSSAAALRDAQVQMAVDWMISHGYLSESSLFDIDFSSGVEGNSIVINGPGLHIVINLPCGPFIPMQREQLMVATAIRILPEVSNGF